MAEIATVARPYAEAVFELAQQADALASWSEALALAAAVGQDTEMTRLASDPAFSKEHFVKLFLDVCGDRMGADAANFIRLLAENGRIALLTEIAEQYEALKANASGIKDATVKTAWPLEPVQIEALKNSLERKLGCKINASVVIDQSLIGGVIITVGDEVYDASVRGKLQEMAYSLNR